VTDAAQQPGLDPDRFFDRTSPGAHEWWYFDAISDDGRDVLVIVWYAGLPFDPSYGVGTLRHLKDPVKHPAPRALDHSAIGLSWHRDGKPLAYALNGHDSAAFRHQAKPFAVEVGSSRLERDGEGYRLSVVTPTVEGRPIVAEVRFRPAPGTEPFGRDLGTSDAPHDWILAAADCRVEGSISVDGKASPFLGRGYHDHNAGAEEMSVAIRRWEWGRVHHGPFTEVYYWSEPRRGEAQSLWLTCRDGRPEAIREGIEVRGRGMRRRNLFGVRHSPTLEFADGGHSLTRAPRVCLDDGPFYRRWLAEFRGDDRDGATGIAELLDTRNLHQPWFNWMIPYRLKRPAP